MKLLFAINFFILYSPLFLGRWFGRDFLGQDFPLFFGLLLQSILGSILLIYVYGYEDLKKRMPVFIGYSIFFIGLVGSYLSGKTIWLCLFWEVSSFGIFYIVAIEGFNKDSLRSLIALFFASTVSMFFIAAWVFLPESKLAHTFFIIGLLIKTSFSIFHIWYPEAHSGASGHISAAYSGMMLNLPFLLFCRYSIHWFNEISISHYLIPIAGIGVFLGGVSSFFSKNSKKALAYSTVENSNFFWMFLFISAFWIRSDSVELNSLSRSYLILFYISLFHHTFSKSFQFLSFGFISKITGSSHIDSMKGMGRLLNLSSVLLGLGTFSFCVIPGSLGFVSESTILFLISRTMDLTQIDDSVFFILAIIFSLLGLVLGASAHLKIYLPTVLSLPSKKNLPMIENKPIQTSLRLLGILLFALPSLFFVYLFISKEFTKCSIISVELCKFLNPDYFTWVPSYLNDWLFKILLISFISFLIYMLVYFFKFSHKIQNRKIWDCGSEYSGVEVSIPASVISDPLQSSLGRYFINPDGEPKLDSFLKRRVFKVLNFGKVWINKVESGDISYYMLFAAISFLVSLFLIIALKLYLSGIWKS